MAGKRYLLGIACFRKRGGPLIILLLLGMLLLFQGCSASSNSLPAKWNIAFGEPPSEVISTRVVLIADNQLHNLYADPVPIMRSGLADKVVEVAIRPVQLDLYAPEVLALVTENEGRLQSIIHLGDACDFSCTGEFVRFFAIMRHVKRGWIMTPGNHDGYFWGNEQRESEDSLWVVACKNAGVPLTKDLLIRYYLIALMVQNRDSSRKLAHSLGIDDDLAAYGDVSSISHEELSQLLEHIASQLPEKYECQYSGARQQPGALLRRIAWKIDREQPWRSFILQEVDISLKSANGTSENPYVKLMLFDTVQYSTAPTLVPMFSVNAGISGEIGKGQRKIARKWLTDNVGQGHIWAFIGHHPYQSFRKRSTDEFNELREIAGVHLYVSAHTHRGDFIVHGPDAAKPGADPNGPDNWLEMNIGSITDWPQVYRTLSFYKYEDRVGMRSARFTLLDDLFTEYGAEDQRPEWEAKPGDQDYFLHHQYLHTPDATKTEEQLRTAMLASFQRMLKFVPTKVDPGAPPGDYWPDGLYSDAKVSEWIRKLIESGTLEEKTDALLKLERFDRKRPKNDAMHRKYRLNQALWASKYDQIGARSPALYDRYIIFP
jgi:hypothetical protein